MRKEALIILAKGFEEVEALTPVDVLRRAGVHTVMAGLDSKLVKGSRHISVEADLLLSEYQGKPDILILPGGVLGAENLHKSEAVTQWIEKMKREDKWIAAICAAPAVVLAPTGILKGRKATCYPGYEKEWPAGITHMQSTIFVDGKIITSQGPGTAFDFSFAIVEQLLGQPAAMELAGQMVYSYPGAKALATVQ